MAKIIVKNSDWDGARAKLQASLDTQQSDFNAKMKAAFSPAAAAKPATAPMATPPSAQPSALSAKSAYTGLPRSRLV